MRCAGKHGNDVGQSRAVTLLGQLAGGQSVTGRRLESLLACGQNRFGGQSRFDLAVGREDAAFVIRRGFHRARLVRPHAGFEPAVVENRHDYVCDVVPNLNVGIQQIDELVAGSAQPRGQGETRAQRGLRFGNAGVRRQQSALGGDQVGPAVDQLGRQPRRNRPRRFGQVFRQDMLARRISTGERLKLPHESVALLFALLHQRLRAVDFAQRQAQVERRTDARAVTRPHAFGGCFITDEGRLGEAT